MYLLYAAATLVSTLSIASASYHSGLNDVHDLFGRDIYTASDIALGRRGDGSSTGSGSISGQGSFRSQGSQGSTSSQGSMKMQGSSGHSGSMKAGGGCFKARCDHMAVRSYPSLVIASARDWQASLSAALFRDFQMHR